MKFTFVYVLLLTIASVAILGYMLQVRKAGPRDYTNSIKLYSAATLRYPASRLAKAYSARREVEVLVEYGGSGQLFRRIRRSRQGDLLLVTDLSYLQLLAKQNPPLVSRALPIAVVSPVIVVRPENERRVAKLDDLFRPDVKLSLANPESSSLGRVLRSGLEREVWEALWENRLSGRESSSEVANDVKLGVADAGIVWETTLPEFDGLLAVPAPELARLRGRIAVGVLTCSERPALALDLAQLLASPEGLKVFERFGFEPVPLPASEAGSPQPPPPSAPIMTAPKVPATASPTQEQE